MAATIARCVGYTKRGGMQASEASRLGNGGAWAQAATWHTFAEVSIKPDGSGSFVLRQVGREPVLHSWPAEVQP